MEYETRIDFFIGSKNALDFCHLNKNGINIDKRKAVELGICCENGLGIEKDKEKAFKQKIMELKEPP
ncbi:hypothetical protein C2G38_2249164 [Gigaspora rosea]|uniref:Uncharacterized protein n=1 Tax=Gigaspora rosea TaxID=44941 RepID=A0A397URW6_9GLOM|nr:hypothetical protein C2G38_2249164 [Gigaspora rosea]